ncbi:unnamed protein product [Larinioides sclopetarius]|uniref:Uncharacterized protein n=1 Tax=Larinioides sclopetarius TaxID=280406 RepID=A0AAV2BL52_9ARAC
MLIFSIEILLKFSYSTPIKDTSDVSNADPGCEIRADAECRLSSVLPLEIPESEADLQLVCTNMERVKKCLVDFLENCTEESSTQIIINEDIPDFEKYQLELKLNQEQQRLKEIKQILDIATELCRENSQLRQGALGSTLSCILKSHAACNISSVIPEAFPVTEAALGNVCSNFKRIEACLRNCGCGSDIPAEDRDDSRYERIRSVESMLNFVAEICRKDSDAFSSVLGFSDLCQVLAHKACHSENLPSGMPNTEEEMVDACEKFKTVNHCIIDDLKTCHVKNEQISADDRQWLDLRQITLEILAQICSLNPNSYSKFLSVKDCTLNVSRVALMGNAHDNIERKFMAAVQKRKERLLRNEKDTVTSLYDRCLSRLIQTNFLIDLNYNKCGLDAKEVVLQILKKIHDWDEICPIDIRIDILELLDDFTSLTRKVIHVKDFLIIDNLV